MSRTAVALTLLVLIMGASGVAQQQAQPARGRGAAPAAPAPTLPSLFFKEEWRQIDRPANAPADFVPERGVTTAAVTNPNLELRLYDAVISWQYRNVMGEIYNVLPGFTAPRAINYYGVRWDFFN